MKSAIGQASDTARRVAPTLFGIVLLGLMWTKAQTLDWGLVRHAFFDIPFGRWMLAGLATAASFWAIGQYDVIAHRHFRTGTPGRLARNSGAASIAVGQTTGFGPAVGAALRWRMMPGLGHGTALRIVTFVTLCFMAAWALLAVTVAMPILAGFGWIAPPVLILACLGLAGLLMRFPRLTLMGKRIELPSIPAMTQLITLAACDLIFAGLALYLLLPPEIAPSLLSLIAAFTLALGAGMIGGTPGGVGPFDLALMTLLPGIATAELAAAIIAFRMVYYAAPCLIGAGYALIAPPRDAALPTLPAASMIGPRAEFAIAAQTDHRAIHAHGAEGVALRTPQTLMLFLGPLQGALAPLLPALLRAAQDENRLPCLYKLTDSDAEIARARGWHVRPFAVEAVIDPRHFTLDGSDLRQLRRFLRKADQAGLQCAPITSPDWSVMRDIHHAWEHAHGHERGLTMGRFCPLYLRDKPLYGAWLNGELVAYISAVENAEAVSLDLMRHRSDLPQGVMHALIHTMIKDAARRGLKEVSLAALPHPDLPDRLADCAGLARFKASFAPRWRALHIAAPSAAILALAALDIRLSILNPAPILQDEVDAWDIDTLIDDAIGAPDPVPLRHVG